MTHRLPARALVAGATAAGVVALAVVLGPSAAAQKTPPKYNVALSEFKITGARTVNDGRVTFVARNTGKAPHEIVVIRTKTRAAKLPVKNGKADEKGSIGKIAPFTGKRAHTKTFTLKRGHYALVCNVPGHYPAGMRADLTVR